AAGDADERPETLWALGADSGDAARDCSPVHASHTWVLERDGRRAGSLLAPFARGCHRAQEDGTALCPVSVKANWIERWLTSTTFPQVNSDRRTAWHMRGRRVGAGPAGRPPGSGRARRRRAAAISVAR